MLAQAGVSLPGFGPGSLRRFGNPARVDAEKISQTVEMSIVVEDGEAGLLRCDRDGEVSERKPVRSV